MPGSLLMRDEASGSVWRVWPEKEVIPPGAIQETGSYVFDLIGCPGAATADLLVDERPLEALRAPATDQARWRWSPGFHAGLVDAELRIPDEPPRRFEIVTDPDRRKVSRDDFDGMVREILQDTFALFSLSSFRKGVSRGSGNRPPAIARLEYLRSRIAELEDIVAVIVRSPRRVLAATEVDLPYHRAQRATGPEILRSFRSGRILSENGIPSRLPAQLKGALPARIKVGRRVSSLDTAEHRQMCACLHSWSAWLSSAAELLERKRGSNEEESRKEATVWARRCRNLSRRVSLLAAEPPFAEAGGGTPSLVLTSVFRNDPAYRRFYRIWQDINLGIAAVFGDFLNLPLARTFELYELWCFLRLVRAGAGAFGSDGIETRDLFITDSRGGITLAAGAVTVPIGAGWKLCFKKCYEEFWVETNGEGSYSRNLIPDVVAIRDPIFGEKGKLIVLHDKYRIESGLKEALNSIHTYRDALVREAPSGRAEGIVTAAYLLAPFQPSLTDSYRTTKMPARLFHPEYRAGFRFGAVTLQPGMTVSEIEVALQLIVADAASV
jgi:hypothetical protein